MAGSTAELDPEDIASSQSRVGAHLVDVAAAYGLLGALLPVGLLPSEGLRTIAVWVWIPLLFFFIFFLEGAWDGKTPGKWLLGIKVVKVDGSPCTYGASVMRNLLRVIDALPSFYIVGLITMTASENAQRLGDMAAGTLVVEKDSEAPKSE